MMETMNTYKPAKQRVLFEVLCDVTKHAFDDVHSFSLVLNADGRKTLLTTYLAAGDIEYTIFGKPFDLGRALCRHLEINVSGASRIEINVYHHEQAEICHIDIRIIAPFALTHFNWDDYDPKLDNGKDA